MPNIIFNSLVDRIQFSLQICSDLKSFQEKHLKSDCEPFEVAVPQCYFSQYTSVGLPLSETVKIEPPESILVLEDMRTYGFKVSEES